MNGGGHLEELILGGATFGVLDEGAQKANGQATGQGPKRQTTYPVRNGIEPLFLIHQKRVFIHFANESDVGVAM